MGKYYNQSNFLSFLFTIFLLFFSSVKAVAINKVLKSEKFFADRKIPQPQRNPNKNYVSCCCFTKLGYYGWLNEIPIGQQENCLKNSSCINDAFLGTCPDAEK